MEINSSPFKLKLVELAGAFMSSILVFVSQTLLQSALLFTTVSCSLILVEHDTQADNVGQSTGISHICRNDERCASTLQGTYYWLYSRSSHLLQHIFHRNCLHSLYHIHIHCTGTDLGHYTILTTIERGYIYIQANRR